MHVQRNASSYGGPIAVPNGYYASVLHTLLCTRTWAMGLRERCVYDVRYICNACWYHHGTSLPLHGDGRPGVLSVLDVHIL